MLQCRRITVSERRRSARNDIEDVALDRSMMRRGSFERIRTLLQKAATFPLARYLWAAAEDARRGEAWTDVARLVERMHGHHWENNNSRFLLGLAYTNLERWPDAVTEFERISGALEVDECEQARWLNYAMCLGHLGRSGAAIRALPPRAELASRFPAFSGRAIDLFDDLSRAAQRDALLQTHQPDEPCGEG